MPPRPENLPAAAEVTAKIDRLRDDNTVAGTRDSGRPEGTALGGPPRPYVAPLEIPDIDDRQSREARANTDTQGAGIRNRAPTRELTPPPAALPDDLAIRTASLPPDFEPAPDLTFATSGPAWFDAKARAAVANYANKQGVFTCAAAVGRAGIFG